MPMASISVAIASPDQYLAIASLLEENRAWLASRGIKQWEFPFPPEWVKDCIERREFYIANVDLQTVGVFRLTDSDIKTWEDYSADAFYLHNLAVRRDWKGKEIGRFLLKWIEDHTRRSNRKYLRLDCMAENPALCAYYEKAGFISCGIKEIQYTHILWKAHLYQKEVDRE